MIPVTAGVWCEAEAGGGDQGRSELKFSTQVTLEREAALPVQPAGSFGDRPVLHLCLRTKTLRRRFKGAVALGAVTVDYVSDHLKPHIPAGSMALQC